MTPHASLEYVHVYAYPSNVCALLTLQRFVSQHTLNEVQELIIEFAKACPHLWRSLHLKKTGQIAVPPCGEPPPNEPPPSWCICSKCRREYEAQDRICCRNHAYNHEHALFERIVLDEHTLQVALINNADWLNLPRIFTAAKMRNTAYRQYILWFWGKLGYKNRKRIPSCIKWCIRDRYPESDGNYMGYRDAY